jgi:hypothetical protein
VTHVSEMARGLERAGHEAAVRAGCHGYTDERGRVLSIAAHYPGSGFGSVTVAAVRHRPHDLPRFRGT